METCSNKPSVSPLCNTTQRDRSTMWQQYSSYGSNWNGIIIYYYYTDRHSEIKEYQEDSSDVTVISARICKHKADPARKIIASQRSQLKSQCCSQHLNVDLSLHLMHHTKRKNNWCSLFLWKAAACKSSVPNITLLYNRVGQNLKNKQHNLLLTV